MKNKKGFTLVELIIVIAIIGILAAVLIPTISGYVEKAHRGRDVELAGHMSTDVTLYATEYDVKIDELTGVDVRTILLFKDYDLKPRREGWVFVFDRTTNQVVVVDINKKTGLISTAAKPDKPVDPTHIEENYFLISKGNSNIEKAVDLMVNLTDVKQYESAVGLAVDAYKPVIQKFDPKTTVFLDNTGAYTTATNSGSVSRMVVLELTSNSPKIPEDVYNKLKLSVDNVYPKTVRTTDPQSQFKSQFRDANDIDLTKIYKIDLPSLGQTINSNGSFYTITLDRYSQESYKQSVSDEVIATILDGNYYIIKRQLTVSYYNRDGLFAQGTMVYAIREAKPQT